LLSCTEACPLHQHDAFQETTHAPVCEPDDLPLELRKALCRDHGMHRCDRAVAGLGCKRERKPAQHCEQRRNESRRLHTPCAFLHQAALTCTLCLPLPALNVSLTWRTRPRSLPAPSDLRDRLRSTRGYSCGCYSPLVLCSGPPGSSTLQWKSSTVQWKSSRSSFCVLLLRCLTGHTHWRTRACRPSPHQQLPCLSQPTMRCAPNCAARLQNTCAATAPDH